MTNDEAATATPAELRAHAQQLHAEANTIPVWESMAARQRSALLRSRARYLAELATVREQDAPARTGLAVPMTREVA
jgi:hypothetical protein